MTTRRPPSPPETLGRSGRAHWREVMATYALDPHEGRMLLELCRTVDALDRLAAIIEAEGEIVRNRFGDPKPHPAAAEARQLRIAYARIAAALRLPERLRDDEDRPPRRVGARGVYRMRSVS